MTLSKYGLQKVKDWYDHLELVLVESAKLSGLYDHNGTIGDAREFFVRRVLRSMSHR
jgi:hypothetical protein